MSESGRVTGRHRRHAEVEIESGERIRCIVRGRQLKPLVGDHVAIERLADGTAVVDSIEKRRSLLTRINTRGRPEGVAANPTQIVIVTAPAPAPDWHLVDRYAVAAELETLAVLLVWNKADLAPLATAARAAAYTAIGYRIIETSTTTRALGIDPLNAALANQCSVLVGQSGVGKSSLINALVGKQAQAVGDLSGKRALGRHTTTAAALYRLDNGGELIDAPGVRQYAPCLTSTENLDWAFREFRPSLAQCRFDDCRHETEPDCAVKRAVEAGQIDAERHASYLKLRATLTELSR